MPNKHHWVRLALVAVIAVSAHNFGVNRGLKLAPEYVAAEAEKARLKGVEDAARAKRLVEIKAARMVDSGVKDPYLACEDFVADIEIWADWKMREDAMNRDYDGQSGAIGRFDH